MSKKNPQPVVVPPPDPEVDSKPTRRRFTAAYKLKILEEADGCSGGDVGALMRREGLYSSHLSTWRRQREEGALQALGKKRGRKAKSRDKEKEQLARENARLRRKLQQAEKIIEIQKKVSALLEAAERDDESGESK